MYMLETNPGPGLFVKVLPVLLTSRLSSVRSNT